MHESVSAETPKAARPSSDVLVQIPSSTLSSNSAYPSKGHPDSALLQQGSVPGGPRGYAPGSQRPPHQRQLVRSQLPAHERARDVGDRSGCPHSPLGPHTNMSSQIASIQGLTRGSDRLLPLNRCLPPRHCWSLCIRAGGMTCRNCTMSEAADGQGCPLVTEQAALFKLNNSA